jgi:hypothetical protein
VFNKEEEMKIWMFALMCQVEEAKKIKALIDARVSREENQKKYQYMVKAKYWKHTHDILSIYHRRMELQHKRHFTDKAKGKLTTNGAGEGEEEGLIKKGVLNKKSPSTRRWQQREVKLWPLLFTYSKIEKASKWSRARSIISSPKHKRNASENQVQGSVLIDLIHTVTSGDNFTFTITLKASAGGKKIILQAPDEKDRREWVSAFALAIQEQKAKIERRQSLAVSNYEKIHDEVYIYIYIYMIYDM